VDCSLSAGTRILALIGELDLASLQALEAAADESSLNGASDVTLDLRRLTFIDSTGTRGVLRLSERCSHHGVGLTVVAGPRAVQKALELTGVAERLTFRDGDSA